MQLLPPFVSHEPGSSANSHGHLTNPCAVLPLDASTEIRVFVSYAGPAHVWLFSDIEYSITRSLLSQNSRRSLNVVRRACPILAATMCDSAPATNSSSPGVQRRGTRATPRELTYRFRAGSTAQTCGCQAPTPSAGTDSGRA